MEGSGRSHTHPPVGIRLLCLVAAAFPILLLAMVPFLVLEAPLFAVGGAIVSVLQLLLLLGLWTLQSWAWSWGLLALALNSLISIHDGNPLGLTLSLILLIYLWSHRSTFRAHG
ncbi:hypothetical protein [Natronorubrum daqingense]|uniref:Uncharacterized protein n=1 Tax=Natronorubrum daqingense TaxID=588898 RepID=A0A1N6XV20_9EURY|nr:hypothetical protein [Natronorubrum daqingense]APX95854.1 hypothetical protein BB347_04040 [Natronorubrum daqingense]SIR06190.1 hypothetical protein SAMN05421809_0230 [Natronorubrum daqingense]